MNYRNLILSILAANLTGSCLFAMANQIRVHNWLSEPALVFVVPSREKEAQQYMNLVVLTELIGSRKKGNVMTLLGCPAYDVIIQLGEKRYKFSCAEILRDQVLVIANRKGALCAGIKRRVHTDKHKTVDAVPTVPLSAQSVVFNKPLKHNEDRWVVLNNRSRYAVYAIFDGHGGWQVAEYLQRYLIPVILSRLTLDTSIEKVLRDSFHEIDTTIVGLQETPDKESSEARTYSPGSCCLVVLIDKITKIMYTANVGDSRALLIRKDNEIALTRDHKPEDPEELRRILSVGATVSTKHHVENAVGQKIMGTKVAIARVDKMLALSRAFGDTELKKLHPGAIIADPEIQSVHIKPEDMAVVLASDGIWNVLENKMAADIVRSQEQEMSEAARALVEWSEQLGSKDDLTAICVDLTAIFA